MACDLPTQRVILGPRAWLPFALRKAWPVNSSFRVTRICRENFIHLLIRYFLSIYLHQ